MTYKTEPAIIRHVIKLLETIIKKHEMKIPSEEYDILLDSKKILKKLAKELDKE